MPIDKNSQGGIHAKRIEAENVVSGTQIQSADTQSAPALVKLAQAIHRGDISADEIKTRNLVSGLQYITDPTHASIQDLRSELKALNIRLDQAITAQEISDDADITHGRESLTTARAELAKSQPDSSRVLHKLGEVSMLITRSAATAEAAGKLSALVIQLAPIAATVWQVAQRIFGV